MSQTHVNRLLLTATIRRSREIVPHLRGHDRFPYLFLNSGQVELWVSRYTKVTTQTSPHRRSVVCVPNHLHSGSSLIVSRFCNWTTTFTLSTSLRVMGVLLTTVEYRRRFPVVLLDLFRSPRMKREKSITTNTSICTLMYPYIRTQSTRSRHPQRPTNQVDFIVPSIKSQKGLITTP